MMAATRLVLTVTIGGLAAPAIASGAYLNAQAYVNSRSNTESPRGSQDLQVTNRTAFASIAGSAASSNARTDFGSLKAAARIAPGLGLNGNNDADAAAQSSDFVTITLPGGGTGFFTATVSLDGRFGVAAPASLANPARYSGYDGDYLVSRLIGSLLVQTFTGGTAHDSDHDIRFVDQMNVHVENGAASLRPVASSNVRSSVNGVGANRPTATPFGSYSLDFFFLSGVPFEFRMTTYCFVQAFSGASAYCDLAHTAHFGGIASVRTAGGMAVTDYGVSAASGLDFAGGYPGGIGVPEPAAWSMFVAGFGLIGGTLRRRTALA